MDVKRLGTVLTANSDLSLKTNSELSLKGFRLILSLIENDILLWLITYGDSSEMVSGDSSEIKARTVPIFRKCIFRKWS